MGLLTLGTPLSWEDAKEHATHVRTHGIIQFLNVWNRIKTRRRDHLLWGDEIEYSMFAFDHSTKSVKLSLDAYQALLDLEKQEIPFDSSWKPEYGTYMIEGTPGLPYGSTLKHLLDVEENMKQRRILAKKNLPKGSVDQDILTVTSFPLLGVDDFLFQSKDIVNADGHSKETKKDKSLVNFEEDGVSRSIFIPDIAINPHARFSTLTKNIRQRRGSKVSINVPIFKDKNTQAPFKEPLPKVLQNATKSQLDSLRKESNSQGINIPDLGTDPDLFPKTLPDLIPDAKEDHIYLDCMCFGMGCSCLQVTFQACSVEEARRLYDQLAVMSPIMLALTAAAPIFRGYLADVDCRWNIIAGSVDDRTKGERGVIPLKEDGSRFRIRKSRYDSINTFLSPGPSYSGGCGGLAPKKDGLLHGDFFKKKYDDLEPAIDAKIYDELKEAGVDSLLAKHYAHLFIRDPLVIFSELLNVDDQTSSDHFENIQSTNWQTMRFKPPPPTAPNIGWRVEFRSMEIQPTDFENAAFSIFVVLLTRTILSFDLNFYMKLSLVDENMVYSQKRDACLSQKFWFRKNIFGDVEYSDQVPEVTKTPPLPTDPIDRNVSPTPSNCNCEDDHESDVRRHVGRQSLQSLMSTSFDIIGKKSADGKTSAESVKSSRSSEEDDSHPDDDVELMSIDEIINGNTDSFPGLVPLITIYLNSISLDHQVSGALKVYLKFISDKASGKIPTTASFIRQFVMNHPSYAGDSKVGMEIVYDLMMKFRDLENGPVV